MASLLLLSSLFLPSSVRAAELVIPSWVFSLSKFAPLSFSINGTYWWWQTVSSVCLSMITRVYFNMNSQVVHSIVISTLFSFIPLVISNSVTLFDVMLYMSNLMGAMAGRFSMTSESWCILALISSYSWIRSSSPWPWMISWSGGSRLSQCRFPLSATIHRSNWRWISCRLWDTPLSSCRPRPCVLHIVHVIVHINFNRHVVSKILILQKYFVKKFITFLLCKFFKNFEYLLEKNFSNTFCLQSFTKLYINVKNN